MTKTRKSGFFRAPVFWILDSAWHLFSYKRQICFPKQESFCVFLSGNQSVGKKMTDDIVFCSNCETSFSLLCAFSCWSVGNDRDNPDPPSAEFAGDSRRRVRSRTNVLQVPANTEDPVKSADPKGQKNEGKNSLATNSARWQISTAPLWDNPLQWYRLLLVLRFFSGGFGLKWLDRF